MGYGASKPTLEEKVRLTKRELNATLRAFERERAQLDANERQLLGDIRHRVNTGDLVLAQVASTDLARLRLQKRLLYEMQSRIYSASLRLQALEATRLMAKSVQSVADTLVLANMCLADSASSSVSDVLSHECMKLDAARHKVDSALHQTTESLYRRGSRFPSRSREDAALLLGAPDLRPDGVAEREGQLILEQILEEVGITKANEIRNVAPPASDCFDLRGSFPSLASVKDPSPSCDQNFSTASQARMSGVTKDKERILETCSQHLPALTGKLSNAKCSTSSSALITGSDVQETPKSSKRSDSSNLPPQDDLSDMELRLEQRINNLKI